MFKRALLGFLLLLAFLLIGFQLLWGYRWMKQYVSGGRGHRTGDFIRALGIEKENRVSSEMTPGQSKSSPSPASSRHRLIRPTAKPQPVRRRTTSAVKIAIKPSSRQEKKKSDVKYLLEYPREMVSPNLPPPCEENEQYVASPAFCKQTSTPFYFLLIMSAAGNFNRRHGLRTLYLRSRFRMSPEFVKQHPWKYAFLIGKPKSKSNGVNVQRKINEESRRFMDVLQVDVMDDYYNLTRKKMAAFDYLIQNNITFETIEKTDDDCYVNIQLVMEWLIAELPSAYDSVRNKLKAKGKPISNSTKYFFGGADCAMKAHPIRIPHNKWYLSEEHLKDEVLPPFCCGLGYVLSYDLMKLIATLPANEQKRSFPLEDVHTGLLVKNSGVLGAEDVAHSKRVLRTLRYGRCVRMGGYPFIVTGEEYHNIRLVHEDFMKTKHCE